jgi:plastocyanin
MRIAVVAAIALVLSAGAPAAGGTSRTYTIVIDQMKFGQTPPALHRGDTILWVNRDLFRHSATAANHSFDIDLPAGKMARMVVKATGEVAFSCKYHPGMRGMLRVQS